MSAVRELSGNLIGKGLRVGIAISRFNDFFTKELKGGALDGLTRHGVQEKDIVVAWVPGANELPLVLQKMAESGKFDALIGLGVVIQGATAHADLINGQVSKSLAKIAMDTHLPVINGVVCAGNLEQAIERCGSKAGNKGWSAAEAAIEMANLYREMGA